MGYFGEKAFFVFLHYKINRSKGVFWPKISLNLTSVGLRYPPEVRVQHETCSAICGTAVHFGPKDFDRVGRGVKEGQNVAPTQKRGPF